MDVELEIKEILFKYVGSPLNNHTKQCIKSEVTDFLNSVNIHEEFYVHADIHGSIGIFKGKDPNG